jgi:hypothetical protein
MSPVAPCWPFCAALAVLDAERSNPDANITNFGNGIWWAVTTPTTICYGDHYRTTAIGRLVAFGLMIGGIALLGTVTATLASWLVETAAAEKKQAEDLQGPPTRGQDRRHSLKFSTPSDRSACISSEQDDQGRRRATAAAWQDRQNVLVLTSGSSEEAGPCPIPALGPRRSRS